ncbi:hypothetical protein Mterra_01856 [Calidithermus terrae]|uniref:Uncharacterized protein n=1 Tax=Calidithermus terrae TaxID=1408545 RepID=A0A399EJK5_9DEIN|nr:hypothetical protein [Calidithermus terrae]RIH84847.1 hypothetical protein Mterra_01856 [Calidithermus terrae]
MSRKIVYNGVEYSSPEEMPPEAQQAYRRMMDLLGDAGGAGTPDLLEGVLEGAHPVGIRSVERSYVINGQRYDSLEAVPPERRAQLEDALAEAERALGEEAAAPLHGFMAQGQAPGAAPSGPGFLEQAWRVLRVLLALAALGWLLSRIAANLG